ncbi:putative armadillo repeat-containing protein 2 [Apostichopus japonicus]|uniref:Putative armadillo repeat-containing protein 2 n=1 Tax=Stichopus japonicus TaxID=307972 RepID=A0A2G8KSJ3_STIJA|nr:putative armadillo repeat-containing protein 2 [Apostichopus japonicus]
MAEPDISTSPTRRKKLTIKPFYEKQRDGETSAEIINEARTSLRTLRTNRPFTPKEDKRTLFSGTSTRSSHDRPHRLSGSRPSSATRLLPLENVCISVYDFLMSVHFASNWSSLTCLEVNRYGVRNRKPILPSTSPPTTADVTLPVIPKPPSTDPNRPISGKRKARAKLMHAISQEGDVVVLPQPLERRSSNPLLACKPGAADDSLQRRVHSGPKERTQLPQEKSTNEEGSLRVRSADSVSSRSTSKTSRTESGYSSERGSAGSRSESAGNRDNLSPEEALYWNTSILPILEDMAKLSQGSADTDVIETLCSRCSELYRIMKEKQLLGKGSKRRGQVLKTIYKLLDFENARLHLIAARMILALSVSGQSMTSLCKLLFKVGRVEENDKLFLEDDVLDLIISTVATLDPVKNSEPLVYAIGSLKCLTGNANIVQVLSEKKLLPVLASLLHSINLHLSETGKPTKSTLNILLQVTAVLRNLADISENRADFLSHQVLEELCSVMEVYSSEADLMLNISRILSKLTLNHECCSVIGDHPTSFQSLILILHKHPNSSDLVVRVCFILGNLTAHNDDCRYCLFNTENAIDTLLSTFRSYLASDLKHSKVHPKQEAEKDKKSTVDKKSQDVLIKLIRVIANLSINHDIGALIASNETCVDLLLQVLECHSVTESDELVINTIITVNNLSYYTVISSAIEERHLTIARLDQMMVMLLDSGDREVVYVACGVLINLMTDEKRRPLLKKESGIGKLIEVLRDFGRTDWQLAAMVCMILCNYTEKMKNSPETLGEQEASSLTDLLVDYLDEEVAMEIPDDVTWDEETQEFMRSYWRSEFCPVASQLLSRVEGCQGDLIPIDKAS